MDVVTLGLGRMAQAQDMIKQAFIVKGVRELSHSDVENDGEQAFINAHLDMENGLNAWLSISMPIHRWRRPPETNRNRDFAHDAYVVQIYARGWLDIDVRLVDHRIWLVEV